MSESSFSTNFHFSAISSVDRTAERILAISGISEIQNKYGYLTDIILPSFASSIFT